MVKKLLEKFVNKDKYLERREIENFLANSVDLVELERRQKMITMGEAPFQKRGWFIAKGF